MTQTSATDMQALSQQLAQLSPQQRILFEKKLAARGVELPQNLPIPVRSSNDNLPLSFAQQRLWFIQQLDPADITYNVASVFRLRGELNLGALTQALDAIVERHEVFRTTFATNPDNQPVQIVQTYQPVELPVIEVATSQRVTNQIEILTQQPFDLRRPLLRLALLRLEPTEHLLLLTTHHMIADRWSVMVFLRELTLLYRARCQPPGSGQNAADLLSPLAIQYADWSLWQRQQLQGEKLQAQTDYWKKQLSGELPRLDLPTDRPYPTKPTYRGAWSVLSLSPELSAQLRALSSRQGTTLFMTLLTGLKVLLHRYSDQTDIVVGSDIANRDRSETEGLIGLLVNTLVLRSDLSGNPRCDQLLTQVRDTVLDAFSHADLPFEKLVELLNPERSLSQMTPLFQVKLDLQQAPVKPLALEGLVIERYPLDTQRVKYELRFNLQETAAGIAGQVEYSTDLFDASTIARMIEHFTRLLQGMVARPQQRLSELPLLGEAETVRLLQTWNQTQRDFPTNLCIHQLFERQAASTPDTIAAVAAKDCQTHTAPASLTYQQLNRRANRLARHLQSLGVGSGDRVGVCLPRSLDLIVALLAVLKAGGCYVPLDPTYPSARLAFTLKDAQANIILLQQPPTASDSPEMAQLLSGTEMAEVYLGAVLNDLSAQLEADNLENVGCDRDLAYIIYTSGSTGQPKGVAIAHRSTVTLLHWAKEQFDAASLEQVLASTSICFDLSIFELFAPLSWGGTVVLAQNVLSLPEIQHPITLINTVPSALAQLLRQNSLPKTVRTVNLAGEALPLRLLQQLQQLPTRPQVFNLYGPSEDTTYSTCAEVTGFGLDANPPAESQPQRPPIGRLPIGRPIANTVAYVLDPWQQLVPVGVAGELYLGGAGLAQGYWNRPGLTAERFVEHPFFASASQDAEQGEANAPRLYRTGDRVRYRCDGKIEFLGRLDHQIKLRGFRIETGEIEAALCDHPAIDEAAVLVIQSGGERDSESPDSSATQLVACYRMIRAEISPPTAAESAKNLPSPPSVVVSVAVLRNHLAQTLPSHMLPHRFVKLDDFPRLPNGKLNRAALAWLAAGPTETAPLDTAHQPPQTDTEQRLVEIWQRHLPAESVGPNDNFFELGGHSLLAVQIMAECQTALACPLPLRQLFDCPTVAQLAAYVEAQAAETVGEEDPAAAKMLSDLPKITPNPAQRYDLFPLTDIQQAYLLGRSQAFELGNVSTHGYREIETQGLWVAQVETALNAMVQRHDMLRVVTTETGQQRILPTVEPYKIVVHDLLQQPDNTVEAALVGLRDRLSHQIFATDRWPLFAIEAAMFRDPKTQTEKTRFYVSFDVLMGDAWSFRLLGEEMGQRLLLDLLNPDALDSQVPTPTPSPEASAHFPPLQLSFRDYVLAQQEAQQSDAHVQAWDYWRSRLPDLPPAPELPLAMSPREIDQPLFVRYGDRLSRADWQRLKQRAQHQGLTPSSLLLAAFAEVLALWSRHPAFTLNLTLFNRQPLHPDVNRIVGDFTSSLLLAVNYEVSKTSFSQRAQQLQRQLWEDLEHRQVSGVKVLRELARVQQRPAAALMPVVFTSTLNQPTAETQQRPWEADVVYSVSQTSQVYLDHQVSEVEGELRFNWDAIAQLFPEGLLDEMFHTYGRFLRGLARSSDETFWQQPIRPLLMPVSPSVVAANQTEKLLYEPTQPEPLLHTLFFQQVQARPGQTAVIDGATRLSYGELCDRVLTLAHRLRRGGAAPNQLIAVSLEKGWEQVVAVLAVLTAGAAYVPIDPMLPQARRDHLLAETEARIILVSSRQPQQLQPKPLPPEQAFSELAPSPSAAPALVQRIEVDSWLSADEESQQGSKRDRQAWIEDFLPAPSADTLAYVIYTSGSTGQPKGVMINHRGAVNTLLDLNQRLELKASDRVLALSSLSFDLSVYDIFGTLAAGATLVMPQPEEHHPSHWLDLLQQHRVTVWNSVPALMQLLLTEQTARQSQATLPPAQASGALSSALLADLPGASALRWVLLSGDWIPLSLPEQIWQQHPQAQLLSLGGATEASIWSIHYPIQRIQPQRNSIPYGYPLSNQRWHVLADSLEPCPVWASGTLYISGLGLAQGYWKNPAKTQVSFITHPQTQERLYKTGDLGRYWPDGSIEFLGREDFQVKLNGYRVELGEIEAVLEQHPAIQTAIVAPVSLPDSPADSAAQSHLSHLPPARSAKATQQLAAYLLPATLAPGDSLSDPLSRLDFKLQRHGIRRFEAENGAGQGAIALPLAPSQDSSAFIRRQSHRQFLPDAVSIAVLSGLLSHLRSIQVEGASLPKYRYASAGSLYPVQTYLHLKSDRIAGASPGFYYYHPKRHQLVPIQRGVPPATETENLAIAVLDGPQAAAIYRQNLSIFEQAAFSIFLVAERTAIDPLYGDRSRDFCLLEAGYMGQLLMEAAPEHGLGLCPLGGLGAEPLQVELGLSDSQELLHGLVGGAIDPLWSTVWRQQPFPGTGSTAPPSGAAPATQLAQTLTEQLQHHLRQKLPEYMLPQHYQWLQSLPLSANGKVDRQALPAPQLQTLAEFVAPRTALEAEIETMWQSVLTLEQLSVHDNFFHVGGNSLSAMQAMTQLRQRYSSELSIRSFFMAPTIAQQAALIETLIETMVGSESKDSVLPSPLPGDVIPTIPNLDQLSDTDVDDLLQQLLREEETDLPDPITDHSAARPAAHSAAEEEAS